MNVTPAAIVSAVEQPGREEQAKGAGHGGLDQHGAADVAEGERHLALTQPDDRVERFRQFRRHRTEQQRSQLGRHAEHQTDLCQLAHEPFRTEKNHRERKQCLHQDPVQGRVRVARP
jgi:hypothetical protein